MARLLVVLVALACAGCVDDGKPRPVTADTITVRDVGGVCWKIEGRWFYGGATANGQTIYFTQVDCGAK